MEILEVKCRWIVSFLRALDDLGIAQQEDGIETFKETFEELYI